MYRGEAFPLSRTLRASATSQQLPQAAPWTVHKHGRRAHTVGCDVQRRVRGARTCSAWRSAAAGHASPPAASRTPSAQRRPRPHQGLRRRLHGAAGSGLDRCVSRWRPAQAPSQNSRRAGHAATPAAVRWAAVLLCCVNESVTISGARVDRTGELGKTYTDTESCHSTLIGSACFSSGGHYSEHTC